jgi:hypothetical protein
VTIEMRPIGLVRNERAEVRAAEVAKELCM